MNQKGITICYIITEVHLCETLRKINSKSILEQANKRKVKKPTKTKHKYEEEKNDNNRTKNRKRRYFKR